MPFELTDFTEAHLASFTKRVEKHGDQDQQAITMGLEITLANFELDKIDAALRESLYKAKDDAQEEMPGVPRATPILRCNSIDRVVLPTKHDGWSLHVDDGIDDTDPMKFGGVKLSKFSVEPKQGGSVVLRLNVGTADIDAERLGKLGMLHGESIWVKILAPEVKPDAIDGSTKAFQADHPDAGDLFAEEHGDDHGIQNLDAGREDGEQDEEGGEQQGEQGQSTEVEAEPERGEGWPFPQTPPAAKTSSRRTRKTATAEAVE